MPVPPKDPSQRRRRNLPPSELMLPAAGRQGDPPPFPIHRPTVSELELWAQLWATPQAVAWDQLGWTRSVARYCRVVIQAERLDSPIALGAEARQFEDRLGLSPMAMRRLAWKVDDRDELEEKRPPVASKTRRVKAVDTSAVAGS